MASRANKKFDCVEMKRKGAQRIRQAVQGMTREVELAYWERGTAELLELQKKLRGTHQNSHSDGK